MKGSVSPSGQPLARLRIHVVPRAKREEIAALRPNGSFSVRVTAPPVEGVANTHLVAFLAEFFGLKRRSVKIANGERSREKTIEIIGMDQRAAEQALLSACKANK